MSATSAAKIDFTKYRSDQLYESLALLLDLRGVYVKSFRRIVLAIAIASICTAVAFWLRTNLITIAGLMLYSVFAGLVAGLFFAIAEVIRQGFDNLLKLASLMLDVCKTIAIDFNKINSGEIQKPTAVELVSGVYADIFLPMLEKAVSENFWILARPVLFLYRLTFGRIVGWIVKMLPKFVWEIDGTRVDQVGDHVSKGMSQVAEQESMVIPKLEWVQQKISQVGWWTKMLVMLPCYTIFGSTILVLLVPYLVAWFMTGQAPVQDEPVDPVAVTQAVMGLRRLI